MKTTPLLHTCSRLLSSRLVAALAVAALSMQSPWAAPTPAQQAYVKASNTEEYDLFGQSVAVSGDTMVIPDRRPTAAIEKRR